MHHTCLSTEPDTWCATGGATDPRLFFLSSGFLRGTSGRVACSAGDALNAGSVPAFGRSPAIGNGNPRQYSCLENFTDRGAWLAPPRGQSWPRLCVPLVLRREEGLGQPLRGPQSAAAVRVWQQAGPSLQLWGFLQLWPGRGAAPWWWPAGLGALRHVGSWFPD